MIEVSIEEAKVRLPQLITAAINGEEVFILQDGQRVVQLVPILQSKRRPQFGSAKGLVKMADDFDDPVEEFKEYMK